MGVDVVIDYRVGATITVEQFIDVLERSTLAARRPVHDHDCMKAMLAAANLLVTAWADRQLVGVARSLTDFAFVCYLADLAVDVGYQRQGIGRALVARTRAELQPRAKIILLAAPAAAEYYGRIGFSQSDRCWTLDGPTR